MRASAIDQYLTVAARRLLVPPTDVYIIQSVSRRSEKLHDR